jgi:hypothetical protein
MNLFIQVENNQTINHPAFEENLIQVFETIPENWEPFVRISCPILGVYQILESDQSSYQKVNGVWTDVWQLRDMTSEEKLALQNTVKSKWLSLGRNLSWIFDEETCSFIPPIDYPTDGNQYSWDENTVSWIPKTQ